jgi:hypothetical protein
MVYYFQLILLSNLYNRINIKYNLINVLKIKYNLNNSKTNINQIRKEKNIYQQMLIITNNNKINNILINRNKTKYKT